MSKAEAGERQRAAKAKWARDAAAESREIGPLPKVVNPRRRRAGKASLERFALDYFPNRFYLPFSDMHRVVIGKLELVTAEGGLSCVAMPRGSGKTALAEVAALRALLYGMRRFLVLIGATALHAARILKRLKTELETNDLLLEDFPEAVYPIRRLERNPKRATMQVLNGESTLIEWTSEGVVLPTVPKSVSSGAAVQVAGLTGAIRGLSVLGADGQPVRPDLVLLDDVQTRESAKSPTQTSDREAIVSDDVLMLAGPTTRIAAVNLCTVVYPNDLSDRFLDAEKHPDWERVRTKTVVSMPSNLDAWDAYGERRRGLLADGRRAEVNADYQANRAALEAGAAVSWAERVKDGDVCALQSAMHVYLDNPRGFHAELQNEPTEDSLGAFAKELRAEDVTGRLNGVERGLVPDECTRLTAGFDVGGELLWYAVVGWDERFGGSVVDYGCWPRQNRAVFEARDARPGLSQAYPGHSESQRVFAGLRDLTAAVLARPYLRAGGGELKVERALVDRGWQPDPVTKLVRASNFAGLLLPSVGIGRTTSRTGVGEWKPRPGERAGYHWRLTVGEGGRGRMCQFDPDMWKTFLWERLTTPLGGAGTLTVPGRSAMAHALLSEHCASEWAEPVTIRGQTFDKWQLRPTRPDNHLWDVLVLAAVAASVAGVRWEPAAVPGSPMPDRPGTRPAVDFAELVRRNRAAKAGR